MLFNNDYKRKEMSDTENKKETINDIAPNLLTIDFLVSHISNWEEATEEEKIEMVQLLLDVDNSEDIRNFIEDIDVEIRYRNEIEGNSESYINDYDSESDYESIDSELERYYVNMMQFSVKELSNFLNSLNNSESIEQEEYSEQFYNRREKYCGANGCCLLI